MASMCCDCIATPINFAKLTRLAVPDFTYRPTLYNQLSGVLRSSLTGLLESILLLAARARQTIMRDLGVCRLVAWSESDRYGLCHDYVSGSLDVVETYSAF